MGLDAGRTAKMESSSYHVPFIYGKTRENGEAVVRVPGSKSITNRALLLAMLSDGACMLTGALFSDDSRYLQQCIADLGFGIEAEEEKALIRVDGLGGALPVKEASVYVGSAGTAARFLTALLGLKKGIWHLDSSEQMKRRPMLPLLQSLQELGTRVEYGGREGRFPFTLYPGDGGKQEISVDIAHSSQFLSALLIAACCGEKSLDIRVKGTHGMAYIDMTLRMMEQFGVSVQRKEADCFHIKAGQSYCHQDYAIEPDVSAACYFYAMAALLGTKVLVPGVHFTSLQGDVQFLRILEKMGCTLWEKEEGVWLKGPEKGCLHGVEADMHACSDQAITLAAIAPYADSPVKINGIGHIRYQESNRMEAIAAQLGGLGIRCKEEEDSLLIMPGKPGPGVVNTYEDHRMAMGFSLTGLRAEGIVIRDPDCCRKTFENYFQVLASVAEELLKGIPSDRGWQPAV